MRGARSNWRRARPCWLSKANRRYIELSTASITPWRTSYTNTSATSMIVHSLCMLSLCAGSWHPQGVKGCWALPCSLEPCRRADTTHGASQQLSPPPAPQKQHSSCSCVLMCACGTVQGPGIPKVSKVAGPFRALWNLVGVLTLLMGLSAAWLVGSQALRSASAGNLGMGSTAMTTSAAAATPSAAASSSAGE